MKLALPNPQMEPTRRCRQTARGLFATLGSHESALVNGRSDISGLGTEGKESAKEQIDGNGCVGGFHLCDARLARVQALGKRHLREALSHSRAAKGLA